MSGGLYRSANAKTLDEMAVRFPRNTRDAAWRAGEIYEKRLSDLRAELEVIDRQLTTGQAEGGFKSFRTSLTVLPKAVLVARPG